MGMDLGFASGGVASRLGDCSSGRRQWLQWEYTPTWSGSVTSERSVLVVYCNESHKSVLWVTWPCPDKLLFCGDCVKRIPYRVLGSRSVITKKKAPTCSMRARLVLLKFSRRSGRCIFRSRSADQRRIRRSRRTLQLVHETERDMPAKSGSAFDTEITSAIRMVT